MSVDTKTTMDFSEVGRHPLLQPYSIQGVLAYFVQHANAYPLAAYFPLVNEDSDVVVMDIEKTARGGLTPAVALGTESPIYSAGGRGQISWEAAEFREKVILVESDLYNLRKIGTTADMESGKELLQRKYEAIVVRLQNRLEWMRRQVLFDNEVRANLSDGTEFVVPYQHPAYLRIQLTGTEVWTNAAADPLITLQRIIENYQLDSGFTVKEIVLPMGGFRILTELPSFRNMTTSNYPAFIGNQDAVATLMQDFLGIGRIREERSQITFATELSASAATAQAVVNLASAAELEAGDRVKLVNAATREAEILTVASVNGKAVTFTSPIQRAAGYSRGDVAAYAKRIIPRNKLLIIGQVGGPISAEGRGANGPDLELMNRFGEVVSTPSGYVDLENRKPGLFSKLMVHKDADPPRMEQAIGIRALPRVNYHDGWAVVQFMA